jgi:hypothetical protein
MAACFSILSVAAINKRLKVGAVHAQQETEKAKVVAHAAGQ